MSMVDCILVIGAASGVLAVYGLRRAWLAQKEIIKSWKCPHDFSR